MASPPASAESRRLLELARRDRDAAVSELARASVEDQVALVCEAPLAERARVLGLLPEPERVIPRLPEAELCFLVKAQGLSDAGWILAHATPEQVVAAVDLDAWHGYELDVADLSAWLAALADGDKASLVRHANALDAELLVLLLRARLFVVQKPTDDEGWQPPEKSQTLEGQFHFVPHDENDDAAEIVALLRALFEEDYWTYFRLMQGSIWELDSDAQEWALRWRSGRLQDMGFPPWDEAMGIYRFIAPKDRAKLDTEAAPLDVGTWALPVWLPSLPATAESGHRVFRAIAELDPEERSAAFYAFVALANKVAVADKLELSDAESTPTAIEKAARFASDGLALVAEEQGLADPDVLRRVTLERLFTVGANLDPLSARG
ncbi:MAG: DUF6178 family protein [Myxococcota bacterium]